MRKLLFLLLVSGMLVGFAPEPTAAEAVAAPSDGLLLVGGHFAAPGHDGLVTMTPDGRFPAAVGERTSGTFGGPEADFAPDGTTFVTLEAGGPGEQEVVVRRTSTNEVVRRKALPDRFLDLASPRFSPDGTRVALAAVESPNPDLGQTELCNALITVRVTTGAVSVIRGGQSDCGGFPAQEFDWSSATSSAAKGRFVWTAKPAGGPPTVELWRPGSAEVESHAVPNSAGLWLSRPRWSPDGTKVAVLLGGSDGGSLYVVDAATGERRRLAGPRPEQYNNEANLVRTPLFSPGGDRIGYLFGSVLSANKWTLRTVPTSGGPTEVVVASRPGALIQSLRDWQPAGSSVAGPPPALAGFTATPDDRRNRLSWTVPTVADLYRVVIYRSTTGFSSAPVASRDQEVVYSGRSGGQVDFGRYGPGLGPDGWSETVIHDRERRPLVNGTTYYYSAFVVDTTGQVSGAANESSTPDVPTAISTPGTAGQIRYVRNTGSDPATAQIWTMNSDGSGAHRLRNGTNEVLSPDRTMIAYVKSTGLWRADADGSDPVRLAAHGVGGHPARILSPTWAPDSSQVAFVRSFEAPVCGGFYCFEETLYTVSAVGGTATRVLGTGLPPTSESYRRSFGELAWGPALEGYPDGRIAFTETYHCPNASFTLWINCFGSLMIVNPDGSEQTYVGRYGYTDTPFDVFEVSPAWSPDGRYLAYEHSDQQGAQYDGGIRVVKADGTEERVLVDSARFDETAPSWTADGQRVVYVKADDAGASDIWLIRRDRTGARNLTRTPLAFESAPQTTSVADVG